VTAVAPGAVGGRTASVKLTAPWLLRWDTVEDERPRVLRPGSDELTSFPRGTIHAVDTVLFDGYIVEGSELLVDPSGVAKERLFGELRGAFTLAMWDARAKRLLAGRDAVGLQPCFYWWNGRILLLSSSLDAILTQPEVGGAFDRVVIAEYLQNACTSHQTSETFYQGVRRLPPAHLLALKAGSLIISRYWDPVPPGFVWADDDEIAWLPSTLDRAVGRCLAAGADSLALSGGFDSVSIAILAGERLLGRPPLHAVSLRFSDTVCDEADTQMAVARALEMPQLMRTIDDSLDGDTVVGGALALSRTSPSPVLSPWQSIYTGLLRSAADLGLNRLLMGTGGDDIFNVDCSYGADRLAAFDLRGLWRFYRAWCRTSPFPALRVARVVLWDEALKRKGRQVARAALDRLTPQGLEWLRSRRQRSRLDAWGLPRDPTLGTALEQRRLHPVPLELARGEGEYVRTLRYLTQAPLLLLEHDQGHAWARNLGFSLLFPYFDRDLVELTLRMPPESLIADGYAKTPLRRLVAERLPTVPIRTKKVDFTQMVHGLLRTDGRAAWHRLGGPRMLAALDIVEAERLNLLMDRYFTGRDTNWLRTWLALSTEMWLRARSGDLITLSNRRA
jgi:asparagine synthase (glutamine-hydrolysing)